MKTPLASAIAAAMKTAGETRDPRFTVVAPDGWPPASGEGLQRAWNAGAIAPPRCTPVALGVGVCQSVLEAASGKVALAAAVQVHVEAHPITLDPLIVPAVDLVAPIAGLLATD